MMTVTYKNLKLQYHVNKNSPIKDLKKTFSKEQNIMTSMVRMLKDGETLCDSEKVKNLELGETNEIEVFIEQKAGGRNPRRNVCKGEKDILEELDRIDEKEEDTDKSSVTSSENDSDRETEIEEIESQNPSTDIVQDENLNEIVSLTSKNEVESFGALDSDNVEVMIQATSETNSFPEILQNDNISYSKIKLLKCQDNDVETTTRKYETEELIQGNSSKNFETTVDQDDNPVESSEPEDWLDKTAVGIQTNFNLENETADNLKKDETRYDSPIERHEEDKTDYILEKQTNEPIPAIRPTWIDELRKSHNFKSKHPIDCKISFFLQQPDLAEVEIKMLENQLELRENLSKFDVKGENLRKRKLAIKNSCLPTKIRKTPNQVKNSKSTECDPKSKKSFEVSPKERNKFFSRLNLKSPSPLTKGFKPSEDEFRQLSVAVHLWAVRVCTGVEFLQKI